MKRFLAVIALWAALPAAAWAQKAVTEGDAVEVKAKIEAIDRANRLVMLKDEKSGTTETLYAGPEVKRFDELKVGDTVTFRYYESIVYQIHKPGQTAPAPTKSGDTTTVGAGGSKPGGTVSRQETVTVDVKSIDPKVPSITVATPSGRTVRYKIQDKNNLKGVAVGDKVEITYTEALIIGVK